MGELEDEFRPLFIEEARGHLERIASGLLVLESAPGDQAAIEGILREAHTMKGAAGMVGMMRVSRLSHRLEDLLVELRAGTRRSTPELTDSMLLVVDGLGRLIASAAGSDQDASDEAALERLLPNAPPQVPLTLAATPAAMPRAPPPPPIPAPIAPDQPVMIPAPVAAAAPAPIPAAIDPSHNGRAA